MINTRPDMIRLHIYSFNNEEKCKHCSSEVVLYKTLFFLSGCNVSL